ncbi:MAG: peptide chain release factor 2 [Chloroflexota bacterium]
MENQSINELTTKIQDLQETVGQLRRRLDVPLKKERIETLEVEAAQPGFWDDPANAQNHMREITRLRSQVDGWEKLYVRINDAVELLEMEDEELFADLETEIVALDKEVNELEFQTLFAAKHDDSDVIFAIHAGAGGTEAQDWASMLLRMFSRWMEGRGLKVSVMDESPGDVTGIKSIMMSVSGDYAYGRLKSEKGVHRLVRISPFDSSARRHTSFAKVEVWPDIAEDIDIEINENELEIQRFKASGAGGQHVQKNETAIRIKHLPTGIVVSCQNQRSLTQNQEAAMKALKSQLYDLAQQKQMDQIAELKGDDVDAGWGSQIRSYVLHPYKMVKDHRTKFESSNPQAVLDGDLDRFMESFLRFSVDQTG